MISFSRVHIISPPTVGLNYTHTQQSRSGARFFFQSAEVPIPPMWCERNIYRRDAGCGPHVNPTRLRGGWLLSTLNAPTDWGCSYLQIHGVWKYLNMSGFGLETTRLGRYVWYRVFAVGPVMRKDVSMWREQIKHSSHLIFFFSSCNWSYTHTAVQHK